MKNKIEEIKRLTAIWYEYVGKDHHKDHDCHWYITQTWSYGNNPIWEVSHYGYIFDGGTIGCTTYEEAVNALLNLIKKAFEEKKEWAEDVLKTPKEWDEYQLEKAKFIAEVKL